jgi:TRAP-type C4-dicarboxylate transport system permease small subunit
VPLSASGNSPSASEKDLLQNNTNMALATGLVLPSKTRTAMRKLARAFAVVGGILVCIISFMTCVSVAGRNTTGWTLVGDLELTAALCGAAVALFLPLCQTERRNITIDFFTHWAPPPLASALERMGALLLGLSMLWISWRSGIGGLTAWQTQAGSMLLGIPEWWVYIGIVPGTALSGVIALHQAIMGFDTTEMPS